MFRIDLDGKVENILNETLKSIIWQNYLSSDGDDVSLRLYLNVHITIDMYKYVYMFRLLAKQDFYSAFQDRVDGRRQCELLHQLGAEEN